MSPQCFSTKFFLWKVLAIFYLSTIVAIYCQSTGNDDTRTPGTSGSTVVDATLARVQKIFPNDNDEFLRRLAYVESMDGEDPTTYRDDYHGGIWQVDEEYFDTTQTAPGLASFYLSISNKFQITWSTVVWQDLRKPLFSAIAARLFLSTIRESIPPISDVDGQARYWKQYYSAADESRTEEFVSAVDELRGRSECNTARLDIAFLVDGSGSVGAGSFAIARDFVRGLVDNFIIGSDAVRVGVIQYSSSPVVEFHLNRHTDKESMLMAINNIGYRGGGTRTGTAINAMVTNLFAPANGARDVNTVPRIGIVMTDGQSGDAVLAPAEAARAAGITMFALGIGTGINDAELSQIANDPDSKYKFEVNNFDVVDNIQSLVSQSACEDTLEINAEEGISFVLLMETVQRFETPIPVSGMMTFTLNTTEGEATAYLSTEIQNPSQSFHQWSGSTNRENSVAEVFIHVTSDGTPVTPPREKRQAAGEELNLYGTIVNTFNATNMDVGVNPDDTTSESAEFTILVEEGDTRIDECASTPCQNGGTCFDNVFSYTCNCASGYEGETCLIDTDECASTPCLNGGTCFDSINSYNCSCASGYEGETCLTDIDECVSTPCLNGGTCFDNINSYNCSCASGYEGETCLTDIDECASTPCQNGGTCFDNINSYNCSCASGYEGETCLTDTNECASTPCLNGGTCFDNINSYNCSCDIGYEGETCLTDINECASTPCLNGGTCFDNINSYNCSCASGYEGETCLTNVDECASTPCQNGGTCFDNINSYTCSCASGYEGETCLTDIDECGSNPCFNGGTCENNVNSFTCICTVDFVGETCSIPKELSLSTLRNITIGESNVKDVSLALANLTTDLNQDAVSTQDLIDAASIIAEVVAVGSEELQVTTTLVESVNNLVDLTQDSDAQTNAPHFRNILNAFETQVERSTGLGQSLEVVNPNIVLTTKILAPNRESSVSLSFAVLNNDTNDGKFLEGDVMIYNSSKEDIPAEEIRICMALPAVLFNQTANDTIGVSFVVHNSDTIFPINSTNQTVGGDIIAAIVVGVENITNLPEPVAIEFTVSGDNPKCVFWDFSISDWSQEGCQKSSHVNSSTDRILCHCNHLTNFAVLVDSINDDSGVVLHVVSKIGCGLSMFALFLTVLVFLVFRRLRSGAKEIPRKILIQLCVALFFLYFVFLVGIDRTSDRGGCIFVATMLHFLTLASLMWMGVEAQNIYMNKVFDEQPEHFLLKASVVAWGVPVLISVISLGAGFSYFDHPNYCFASGPPLHYGLFLPVVILLLHNFVTFAMVMYRLCKANHDDNHQTAAKEISQRLQNAFAVSILMGLTWVFGLFAIHDATFAFSLIFFLCNSFQGVAVLILFCLRQEDVKMSLRPYIGSFCFKRDSPKQGSETASTGVSTSAKKSPSSDPGFSAPLPMKTLPTGGITATSNIEENEPESKPATILMENEVREPSSTNNESKSSFDESPALDSVDRKTENPLDFKESTTSTEAVNDAFEPEPLPTAVEERDKNSDISSPHSTSTDCTLVDKDNLPIVEECDESTGVSSLHSTAVGDTSEQDKGE